MFAEYFLQECRWIIPSLALQNTLMVYRGGALSVHYFAAVYSTFLRNVQCCSAGASVYFTHKYIIYIDVFAMSSFPFTGNKNTWILMSEHIKREGRKTGVDVLDDSNKFILNN